MCPISDSRQRRDILRGALGDVGYGDAHVQFDWHISDSTQLQRYAQDRDSGTLPSGEPFRLDVAAFYDERERNWDTTAFVAELDRPDLLQDKQGGHARAKQLFELTAAPCSFFAGNGTADLWLKCWQQDPQLVPDIRFADEPLRRAFRQNRRDLDREALARLRGGQRYLFDGVYHTQREDLVQFLHRGLSKATWLAPMLADEEAGRGIEDHRKALSRVAIALMAARILEDKGFFGTAAQSTDARQILQSAEQKANGFFHTVITRDLAGLEKTLGGRLVEDMLRCLMAHLTGPACFTMVTPEMIGYLYETALIVERKQRGDLALNGIHYTPRPIAQHILSRIPVEELRPSDRYVLDFASGSGSFLLSATERLRSVFDAREDDSEPNVLQHLRKHVIGNDRDSIAPLVTRLSYLIEHWTRSNESKDVPEPIRLDDRDALTLTPADFWETPPSVIVGNPPFAATAQGQQLANRFLAKSLDLLRSGGFLGMIMPGPFLKQRRDGSKPIRERLLRECELLEVWEQPLQTVGLSARQETCVIIGRKTDNRPAQRGGTLFKLTYSSKKPAIQALREQLRSTFTLVATGLPGKRNKPWVDDDLCRIIASPVDAIWRKLGAERTIGAMCETGLGIKAILGKAKFSPDSRPGFRPYLRHQRSIVPYFLLEDDWRNDSEVASRAYIDPRSARWPKPELWPMYERRKLVLTNNTNRNSSCQLRAAFDQYGIFPDGDIACLVLRKGSSATRPWASRLLQDFDERSILLWLAAILNSPVGHAWVASCAPPRATPEEVRTSLPVPATFDLRIPELVEKTLDVSRSGQTKTEVWQSLGKAVGPPTEVTFEELAGRINMLVMESYGLSVKDARTLQAYLEGMTNPWVDAPEVAHLPLPGSTYRRITARVLCVDIKRQEVTLDIPRYSRKAGGPLKVPLPKHMPGWALRDGAEFTCMAPSNRREPGDLQDPWLLREFRPLPYPYLEPSEIEKMAGFRLLRTTT